MRWTVYWIAGVLLAVAANGYCQNASPQARALVLKIQQAFGDANTLRQVRSIHSVTTIAQGGKELEADIVTVLPDRMAITYKDKKGKIQARNVYMPGSSQLQPGADDYQKVLKELRLNPISAVLRVDDPSYRFSVGASMQVNGINTTILAVTVDGQSAYWYVDPSSGRILRSDEQVTRESGDVTDTYLFSDWKTIGGITQPAHITVWESNQLKFTEDVKLVEYNATVGPEVFQQPAGTAAAASSPGSLQKELQSQFTLTKMTADKSDVAAAGSVVTLQKPGLLMYAASYPAPPQSTYKNAKIVPNVNFGHSFLNAMTQSGPSAAMVQRTAAAGETFWVTKIAVQDKGVIFTLFSDPESDGVRYFGELKFPVDKGSMPQPDVMLSTISEVLAVEPAAPQAPAEVAKDPGLPGSDGNAGPVDPPPPPPPPETPPTPKTISLGQTKDQVEASFGQPQKKAVVGNKEIYYYADMKVTFINGKVSDVQ